MSGRDLGVDKVIWLRPIRMSDFDTDSLTSASLFSFSFFSFLVFWLLSELKTASFQNSSALNDKREPA